MGSPPEMKLWPGLSCVHLSHGWSATISCPLGLGCRWLSYLSHFSQRKLWHLALQHMSNWSFRYRLQSKSLYSSINGLLRLRWPVQMIWSWQSSNELRPESLAGQIRAQLSRAITCRLAIVQSAAIAGFRDLSGPAPPCLNPSFSHRFVFHWSRRAYHLRWLNYGATDLGSTSSARRSGDLRLKNERPSYCVIWALPRPLCKCLYLCARLERIHLRAFRYTGTCYCLRLAL